jgi:hypothetical protein
MNERDLPRTRVTEHTRKSAAPRRRREESNAATAATHALRTVVEAPDNERHARALCGVLQRWCDASALDVARRMVAILGGEP